MKIKTALFALLFVVSLAMPSFSMAYAPQRFRPPVNPRQILERLLEDIKLAVERHRMDRDAEVERQLQIPGATPVPVEEDGEEARPELPERIDPASDRWVTPDQIREKLLSNLKLPSLKDEE